MAQQLTKLVDNKSIKALAVQGTTVLAELNKGIRAMDAGGLLLSRHNIILDPYIFRQQYPDVTWDMTGVEISNIGGIHNTIDKIKTEATGSFAKNRQGDGNTGIISLKAENASISVVALNAKTEPFTKDDLEAAAASNRPLVTELTTAMFRIFQRENDQEFYRGTTTGGTGLLNNGLFKSATASADAKTSTGLELFTEISEFITDQWNDVLNVNSYKANVIVMPTDVFNTLTHTHINTAGGLVTVKVALEMAFAGVKIMSSFRCNDTSKAGQPNNSVVCAFASGKDAMVYRLPKPLTIHAQFQLSATQFQIEADYRLAGLDIVESLSGRKLIGL